MPTQMQLEALHAVVPAAQSCMQQFGVPASVTLAQWVLESAWGESGLAKQCNNCFGVKAVEGQDYGEYQTREVLHGVARMVPARFARYSTVLVGFQAHARLLASLARYAPAMRARHDVPEFCSELQLCGYSTAPSYAQMLLSLIRELNLTQYDTLPPVAPAAAVKEIAA